MQWIYLICFILISAGLLALFGVKPGDFIDALFRSQRKSATLSDELNVLLGTPAKRCPAIFQRTEPIAGLQELCVYPRQCA